MADDVNNPLTDADGTPSFANPSGTGSFRGLGAQATQAESRRRRTRQAVSVVTGLAVLGGVAIVASTMGGRTHPYPGALRAGSVPPQVSFADAKHGYALFTSCASGKDSCAPTLYATDDGSTWHKLTMPAGLPDAPTWPTEAVLSQGRDVLVQWLGGAAVSADGGAQWHQVVVSGTSSSVPPADFLVAPVEGLGAVDPVTGSTMSFLPPSNIERQPQVGGVLSNGWLWLDDGIDTGVSVDGGTTWPVAQDTLAEINVAPQVDLTGKRLARVYGPVSSDTTGVPGDGGELPADNLQFSFDRGSTWQTTSLTGARVNALCTAYLADGSVLGVSVDGTKLLRLAKGAKAFVPAATQPPSMPTCLGSTAGIVWGATLQRQIVTSPDGKVWKSATLPAEKPAVH